MKCYKCGRILISRIGEKGVICSCCRKIECFECAGILPYPDKKPEIDECKK